MKRKVILLLGCVLFVILSVGSVPSDDSSSKKENKTTETQKTEVKQEEIVYEKTSAKEMLSTLEKNALKAEETYKEKNLEITGEIDVIDSDGKYISIGPVGDDFNIAGIQATIKNDDQKKVIMELSKGSKVVIKGKVKSIGEVLGYSVDIDEITQAPTKSKK